MTDPRDDLLGHVEPLDPDIELISDYLDDELSDEETAAVVERLASDEEFFNKVAPIIKVWMMPVNLRTSLERYRLERDVPKLPISLPMVVPAPEALIELRRPRRTLLARMVAAPVWTAIAATLLLFLVGGPLLLVSTIRSNFIDRNDAAGGRAPTGDVQNGKVVETRAGETATELFPHGTRVVLQPNSHLQWVVPLPLIQPVVVAALEGEAAFEVTKGEVFVALSTPAGRLRLSPGTYAVRCAPGCDAMLVTVGTGALNVNDRNEKPLLSLSAGEFARVPKGGAPERTTGGPDYPRLPNPGEPPR